MRVAKSVAIAVMMGAVGVWLAACGQKGPLYLPDQGGEVVTRPGGGQTQSSPSTETAPQPSTQTPPQPKPEDQKKEQSPR